MSISVNWATKVIFVPKADTTLLQSTPQEIRELDLNVFRLALKNLEDDDEGIPFPHTHNHVAPISVGGVTLARVIEIINDYTVTFEDGQYAVNLVGANSNVGDRVNVNQVSVRSTNSAGLVQSQEIEHSSFLESVTIDIGMGVPGTLYPTGTPRQPVNNLSDAILIAEVRGFHRIIAESNLTIDSGDLTKFIFESHVRSTVVTVSSGATLTGCHFDHVTLTGEIAQGSVHIRDCLCNNLTFKAGRLTDCSFTGTFTIGNSAGNILIARGLEGDSGSVPIFDLANLSQILAIREFYGDIQLNNLDSGNVVLDIQGRVILDASCVGGSVKVRGIGHVENNSQGTAVDTSDLVSIADSRMLTVGKFLGLS